MQDVLPEALAKVLQFACAVTQLEAQVVIAEQYAFVRHVMHVQGIRHGANHIRPETLALDQGQLDAFTTGDIADAQGHRLQILWILRET